MKSSSYDAAGSRRPTGRAWRALRINPPNHRFILGVDKDMLEGAPGFDNDHWPSLADEQWAREVHTYYKTSPYWD